MLGVELIYRGAKFSSPYVIALVSILPELIITLQASFRSNYYVALSTVLGSVISLYVIGVSFFGLLHFIRWKSDFKVGAQREYTFVILTSISIGLLGISGKIDIWWGIVLLALFLVYSAMKMNSNLIRSSTAIPALVIGSLIVWVSSSWLLQDIFSLSSAFHVPPYYVAILIVPIMSNLQEISTALRSKKENVMRDLLLGVINENLMASSLLLSIIGFASGIQGIALASLTPLVEVSFFVGMLAYALMKNGDIKVFDSLLMLLGLVVFLSVLRP
ncbi:sodium:calcium antiporter [Metallosphaera hakonensis JCM 8857 = DSM 7519]|uniref:Sodium:calcium antiporter n=2 Tax=Metallosphaera hakonensis TaxID=79601 RepID=A0A2U9IXE5_9CREN|nr:sodium:calcium antiporter [Metallosphaera hakonensis JCM 8857 = DSM 7519]